MAVVYARSGGQIPDPVARQAHEAARLATLRPEPWPEPEVPCRPAREGEIPRSAEQLGELAADAGWHTRYTYARGHRVARGGVPGKVVDSLAVRMTHPDGRRAWGVWHDGSFVAGGVWTAERIGRTTLGQLRALVTGRAEGREAA